LKSADWEAADWEAADFERLLIRKAAERNAPNGSVFRLAKHLISAKHLYFSRAMEKPQVWLAAFGERLWGKGQDHEPGAPVAHRKAALRLRNP
jgi:hypothetical protein